MTHHVAIGIVGGVGPEAGCLLHQYVIEETHIQLHTTHDQDHFEAFHLALPGIISDRSEFILQETSENPANGVYQVLELLEQLGTSRHEMVVTGIPCNTFHVDEVYCPLQAMLAQNQLPHIDLVNMIDVTIAYIQASFPGVRKIGLLSTTGSRKVGLYHTQLQPLGYELLEVPWEKQAFVHEGIYDPEWGIKAVSPVSVRAVERFEGLALDLIAAGAEIIILGCTELPIALSQPMLGHVPLINPMKVLAHELVCKAVEYDRKFSH